MSTTTDTTALWRFLLPTRSPAEERAYREHYLQSDINQVTSIIAFALIFMMSLSVADLIRSVDVMPPGLLIRIGFIIIGAVMLMGIRRLRTPWIIDANAVIYSFVIVVGVLYFHADGSASVERMAVVVTLFIYVANLAFPTYPIYVTPAILVFIAGEAWLMTRADSPSHSDDAVILILVMLASLGMAALGSAILQRGRFTAFHARSQVRTLTGLIPICASCKKMRDDDGFYRQVEEYLRDHSDAEFSHGYCPDCAAQLLAEVESGRRR